MSWVGERVVGGGDAFQQTVIMLVRTVHAAKTIKYITSKQSEDLHNSVMMLISAPVNNKFTMFN